MEGPMNRRELLKKTLATGAALGLGGGRALADPASAPFRLKYAPHFGMFERHAGKDLVDQLKFRSTRASPRGRTTG
jgi:hydroxypyruvate isomerase